MKAAFLSARKEFQNTGTQEALKDKISGIKEMIKEGKAKDASEVRMSNLTAALEKWEAKLTEWHATGFWNIEHEYYKRCNEMQIDTLNKLTNCNENSLLVSSIPNTPQHDQTAPMPAADSATVVEPVHSQNRSNRR